MHEISDMLAGLTDEAGTEGFLQNPFESTLHEIISRNLHVDVMNSILSGMVGDVRDFEIFTSGAFFNIVSLGDLDLTLVRYKQITKYIYSSPIAYSQAQISPGFSRVATYRLADDEPLADIFDPGRTIERVQILTTTPGQVFSKTYESIVDLAGFDTLPTMYLRLSAPPRGGYEWAFDRDTLAAKRYSTIYLAESNLCAIFDVLGEVGDAASEDYLERYTAHSHHFVRWKAVQSLAALNPARAFPIVCRLQDDAHPDVRAAAKTALSSCILTAG